MTQTIIAIERDGFEVRTLSMRFAILKAGINLKEAVHAACVEYVNTKEGRDTYLYNCNNFNWADFATNVPEDICRKHGFILIDDDYSEEEVDWDEQLVDDNDIRLTAEQAVELMKAVLESDEDDINSFLNGYNVSAEDFNTVGEAVQYAILNISPSEAQAAYENFTGEPALSD